MSKITIVLVALMFGTVAFAAEINLVSCQTKPRIGIGLDLGIDLSATSSHQLTATMTDTASKQKETFTDLIIGDASSVDADFAKAVELVNKEHETGIDPTEVGQVQFIQITGNSDFNISLVRLYDRDGKPLGWLVWEVSFFTACL